MRVDGSAVPLRRVALALLLVAAVGATAVAFLGSQVSGVLSTVGAPIGDRGAGHSGAGQGDDGGGGQAAPPSRQDGPSQGTAATVYSIDRPDLLIIKTGSIGIQVADMDTAINRATDAITALDGYVSGSSRSGDGADASASITFRVPAARWEAAFEAIRGVAEDVLDEESTSEEVTGEVADLGARIRNLEATERALQSIMDRASAIKDVLTVQSELTDVRGEIEQLATQKARLEAQAAMSTLKVRFALRHDPVRVVEAGYDPATEVSAATAQLVDILQALLTAGIWLAIVWLPILVTIGVFAVSGYLIARRVRRSSGHGAEVALRP